MKITRRRFLAAASAASAILLPFKQTAFGQGITASGDALAELGWDSFLPFVNTKFVFAGKGGMSDVRLELVEMRDSRPMDSVARKTGQENFVMKFTGPSSHALQSGTYIVEHFRLGTFNLFITEGGQNGKTYSYFAVINRVLS